MGTAVQVSARVLALGVAVGLVSVAGGCKPKAVPAGAEAGAPPPASLTPEQAQKVLAKVGDRTLTLGDYAAALEHMDPFDRLRYQSPERRKELLTEMINVELLAQEAVAKGYDKDPLTQQEIRTVLRDAMLAEARKDVPAPAEIPESAVRTFYDAHKADFRDPERRRLSLLVVATEAAAKDALEAAKKTTTAAQWGELVRARSQDPQAKATNVPVDLAGDVGFVVLSGGDGGSPSMADGGASSSNPKVPLQVAVAAFEIGKVGEILPRVVAAGDRHYLIRLTQKTDAHERTLTEAERSIRVRLAQEHVRTKEQAILAQLRTEIPVQIDEAALAKVKVDLPEGGAGR